MTAAGWLLPVGLPPRIGDRLRAGQGHCENESGGQNYRERQRIADVPTATSTPLMRSCQRRRRPWARAGDFESAAIITGAFRRSERRDRTRRTAAAARASGGRAGHRVLVRPAHHHGSVPQSDRPSGSRLAPVPDGENRSSAADRLPTAAAGSCRHSAVNRSWFSLAPGRSLARARHTLAVAGRHED